MAIVKSGTSNGREGKNLAGLARRTCRGAMALQAVIDMEDHGATVGVVYRKGAWHGFCQRAVVTEFEVVPAQQGRAQAVIPANPFPRADLHAVVGQAGQFEVEYVWPLPLEQAHPIEAHSGDQAGFLNQGWGQRHDGSSLFDTGIVEQEMHHMDPWPLW